MSVDARREEPVGAIADGMSPIPHVRLIQRVRGLQHRDLYSKGGIGPRRLL